ncbi:MAG: S8 family serine peptidase, partial [Gammaproteobacteria bacterium]
MPDAYFYEVALPAHLMPVSDGTNLEFNDTADTLGLPGMVVPMSEQRSVKIAQNIDGRSVREVIVQVYPDTPRDVAYADFKQLADGCESSLLAMPYGPSTWIVELEPACVQRLAELDVVRWVEKMPPPIYRQADGDARALVGSQEVHDMLSVTGKDVNVAVSDWGIHKQHVDFQPCTRFYALMTGCTSKVGDRHGTRIASIIGGAGKGDAERYGHARNALLGEFDHIGVDEQKAWTMMADKLTRVSSHSYGLGKGEHFYSADDKNAIVVGSIDLATCGANRDRCEPYDSGYGYTADLRIKPDVVAPGCNKDMDDATTDGIWMAIESDENGDSMINDYRKTCAVSFAAPVVTAGVALIMEQLDDNASGLAFEYPATYKAVLVQTAVDQTTVPGPDTTTGWGLIDLYAAVDLVREVPGEARRWREASVSMSVGKREFCMTVPKSDPIKVTLAWDDTPGKECPVGGSVCNEKTAKLTQDLDLTIYRAASLLPDTTKAWGIQAGGGGSWIMAPNVGDHRNNVEMVTRDASDANAANEVETWRVAVEAHQVTGDQGFG